MHHLPGDMNLGLTSMHDFFGPLNALERPGFQTFHDSDHATSAGRLPAGSIDR